MSFYVFSLMNECFMPDRWTFEEHNKGRSGCASRWKCFIFISFVPFFVYVDYSFLLLYGL